MSKHRDLAQVVYSSTLGRDSAQRIWRSVVVAGAMLATPMIASAKDPTPPPATTEKAPPPPTNSKPAPPPPTKADLLKLAQEALKALEAEGAALDKTIAASVAAVESAQTKNDRDFANAKLKSEQKKKADLKPKIAAAKAEVKKADAAVKAEAKANKPKPRPRGDDEIRPKGRGFILS